MNDIQVMSITPAIAEKMLEKNFDSNRKISNGHVASYASSMSRGEWKLVFPPIVITSDGTLIDGQHRLMAVVKSGTTIEMYVQSNASMEDYSYLDIGLSRSAADIYNGNNATGVCAVAKSIYCIEKGNSPVLSSVQGKLENDGMAKVSKPSTVSFVVENEELLQEYYSNVVNLSKGLGFKKCSIFAVFLWSVDNIFLCENQMDRNEFCKQIASDVPSYSSVVRIKSQFFRAVKSNKKLDAKYVIGNLVHAYVCASQNIDCGVFNKWESYFDLVENGVSSWRKEHQIG